MPEHVATDETVSISRDDLHVLIEQAARESAEAVRRSYENNAKLRRGLELAERYDRMRRELADRQVEADARRDHIERERDRVLAVLERARLARRGRR